MIRFFDFCISAIGLILLSPILLMVMVLALLETKSPLFLQKRVGQYQRPFTLVKFRTMRKDTASMPTHLAPTSSITLFGKFLRRSKLDELPQLWNVLKGDMSLVGPRPCLPSQDELIAERAARDVFRAKPGITGLAQINGVDMSTPKLLAETDAKMIDAFDLHLYLNCLVLTIFGKGRGDRVR